MPFIPLFGFNDIADTFVMYNRRNNPGNQTLFYNMQFNQKSVVIIPFHRTILIDHRKFAEHLLKTSEAVHLYF